jgi:hypothetical protein
MMLHPVDPGSQRQLVVRRGQDAEATFSDGDFSPRSYADSVACDVPDKAARRACDRPRARRARSSRNDRSIPEDELLTLYEVAEILMTSPNTVRWWRQMGTGPESFEIGRRLYTTVGDLRRWIREQRLASQPVIRRPKAV